MDNQRARGVLGGFFGALLGGILGVAVGFLASGAGVPKKAQVPQDALVQLVDEAAAPVEVAAGIVSTLVTVGVAGLIGAIVGAALGTYVVLRGTEPSLAQPPPTEPKTDPGAKSGDTTSSEP